MILSDFLSWLKHETSDQHEIIPISFNIQETLHIKYYNRHENEIEKHLVQTRSQTKTSGTVLHNIDKECILI